MRLAGAVLVVLLATSGAWAESYDEFGLVPGSVGVDNDLMLPDPVLDPDWVANDLAPEDARPAEDPVLMPPIKLDVPDDGLTPEEHREAVAAERILARDVRPDFDADHWAEEETAPQGDPFEDIAEPQPED